MGDLHELNPAQQSAVTHLDSPLLVLAGAGSGKTRVITRKIEFLIRECGYAPRTIAAVTFTNKAAREMKLRVGELIGGKETRGLRVSTFHTLGLGVIGRELEALSLRKGFSIYDGKDSARILKSAIGADLEDDALRSWQSRISSWKNRLITPDVALSTAENEHEADMAVAFADYERQLRAYNAVDFDDLISLPLTLFQSRPDILDEWQNRVRYLLVDEYQDTNHCQYQMVKSLIGVRAGLTAVGDDDQSIYAWRGAEPENLKLLQEDFPQLKVIKLEQNYRSTKIILDSANHLISHNPHIFQKKLWSDLGQGDKIRVMVCASGDQEIEKVVSEIVHHQFRTRSEYSQYAILYRGNHQSREFERTLREYRIPYQLTGGTSFFEHTEVKEVLAYLRLLINPADNAALLRIINVPKRAIGSVTLEKLATFASEEKCGLFQSCFAPGLSEALGTKAAKRVSEFAHWMHKLSAQADIGKPTDCVNTLLKDMDYTLWLQESSPTPKAAERRLSNVSELVGWLGRLGDEDGKSKTLADVVSRISLLDMLDRNERDQGREAVFLMTLHASKGLEFPYVFMVGMEEEILPHHNSIEAGTVEEERRLAYVGITRAQRNLTLSLAKRRKRYGEWRRCLPSRFLEELPEAFLEWEGVGKEVSDDERKDVGRAHLAHLKALLANS